MAMPGCADEVVQMIATFPSRIYCRLLKSTLSQGEGGGEALFAKTQEVVDVVEVVEVVEV